MILTKSTDVHARAHTHTQINNMTDDREKYFKKGAVMKSIVF